jgi:hypothetical protein
MSALESFAAGLLFVVIVLNLIKGIFLPKWPGE